MEALVVAHEPQEGFGAAMDKFEEMIAFLRSGEAKQMTHSDLERLIAKEGTELLRRMLQAHLDQRSPGEAQEPVRAASGIERRQKRLQERSLESIFGTVQVERMGYGGQGEASLHPLDGELNLPPERYSLELRRRAAERAAMSSFDETVRSVREGSGAHVAKRQVEQIVVRAGNAEDFEQFYAQRSRGEQPSGEVMVISADGKGVVMRPEGLRERTRKLAKNSKHKMRKRLSKGEKRNRKRMATVAAVYTIEPYVRTPEQIVSEMAPVHAVSAKGRPRPESKRIWADLERQPEQVLHDAFCEAERRDPQWRKKLVALVDGDLTQLKALKKLSRRRGIDLTIVLDIIHVVERLWQAAHAFHGDGTPQAERWVSQRLLQVLKGRAPHVAAGIRRSATLRKLAPDQRKLADKAADYLLSYKRYLRYDQYLAEGFPIATGVIEGACRHLVRDRMEITGARWSLQGAQAVLRLRALRASGDFEAYWRFHEEQELRRNHLSRYADNSLPQTRRAPRHQNHLALIKS